VNLFLMRHAEAESGAQMDPTRSLTPTGKDQAKMMGKWLKRQDPSPSLLLQSNFKRSQSTAKRVGKKLGLEPVTCGALDPEGTPENAWDTIKKLAVEAGEQDVIAISHGPLVENLLAYLTGSDLPQQFHFAHAAVAHFETTTGKRGIMHWLVTPNVVARDQDEMDLVRSDAQKAVEAALKYAEACMSAGEAQSAVETTSALGL
jgi:phosphohistidine phosphatase